MAVLARANSPLDQKAAFDDVLKAILERLEYENIISDATNKMFF
ncbi:MAG: hypothetical protein O7G83_03170 [Proteobacteria bacterium]|nr:hypothetical protein [Pseudomonadota bacterium]